MGRKASEYVFGGGAKTKSKSRESIDKTLRAAGFQIWSRPAKGEPLWVKDGEKYPQSSALIVATQLAVKCEG